MDFIQTGTGARCLFCICTVNRSSPKAVERRASLWHWGQHKPRLPSIKSPIFFLKEELIRLTFLRAERTAITPSWGTYNAASCQHLAATLTYSSCPCHARQTHK